MKGSAILLWGPLQRIGIFWMLLHCVIIFFVILPLLTHTCLLVCLYCLTLFRHPTVCYMHSFCCATQKHCLALQGEYYEAIWVHCLVENNIKTIHAEKNADVVFWGKNAFSEGRFLIQRLSLCKDILSVDTFWTEDSLVCHDMPQVRKPISKF